MNERLKLTPGLPPYQWWLKPPPEVRLRVFIFTVENPEEFLNGTEKLKFKEFGPIIYRENLQHKDVIFHEENSTLTYTAVREAEFIEEANIPGILNTTILVPNLANLVCSFCFCTILFLNFVFFLHCIKGNSIISARCFIFYKNWYKCTYEIL